MNAIKPTQKKRVRFQLPDETPAQPPKPPSILRPPPSNVSPAHDAIQAQPTLKHHSSLPTSTYYARHKRHTTRELLRGMEALHSIRGYLRQLCNLENTAHSRRVLRPLSIQTLEALLKDAPTQVSRELKLVRSIVEPTKRHPHECLCTVSLESDWERCVRQAFKWRERREADYHLHHFVAHQLRMPVAQIQHCGDKERYLREVEAFRLRMETFSLERTGARNSAPNSPARQTIPQRESRTDPIRSGRSPSVQMSTLELPSAIAPDSAGAEEQRLAEKKSAAKRNSPFPTTRESPYVNTRQSPYTNTRQSPYTNTRQSPYTNTRQSPYVATATSPLVNTAASPYGTPSHLPYPPMQSGIPPMVLPHHTAPYPYPIYQPSALVYAPTGYAPAYPYPFSMGMPTNPVVPPEMSLSPALPPLQPPVPGPTPAAPTTSVGALSAAATAAANAAAAPPTAPLARPEPQPAFYGGHIQYYPFTPPPPPSEANQPSASSQR